MCVTSPPYWGLRSYKGVEPTVWGGSGSCRHEWGGSTHYAGGGQPAEKVRWQHTGQGPSGHPKVTSAFCRLCGCWRGCLGLEPTPELFIEHLVGVFREVKRVLRDDGTVWLNLGDSYTSGGRSGHGTRIGYKQQTNRGMCGENDPRRAPQPSNLKPKDLVGIPWRVALALQADGWWLRSDIIWHKCLSGGTRVYAKTQKGEMPMTIKDMVRLDPATVKLWDGEKWNQAVGWELVKRVGDELEIELRSGERIGCTRDHRWPLEGLGLLAKAEDLNPGDVLQRCELPEPESPRVPYLLPAIEVGWFVGLYIAEGSQSNGTIQIASNLAEDERFERLKELTLQYDGHIAKHQTSEHGMTININSPVLLGILRAYVSGKDAKTKHLQVRCWARSNVFLVGILDGYLDGDGHFRGNGQWRLGFCKNDNLVSDLRTLCARLGYSVRLKRCQHTLNGRKFPGWRGSLAIDQSRRRTKDTEIIAVRKSRARKFWHITLQDEPHLFTLASGVCTHNSNPMPESVTDRPTRSHEYVFLLTKAKRYYYDADAIKEAGTGRNSGRIAEDKAGVGAGFEIRSGFATCGDKEWHTRNKRTVWTIPTKGLSGAHFATFPPALVTPCILAGSGTRSCPVCGAAWRRVVEKVATGKTQKMADGWATHEGGHGSFHRDGREQGEPGKHVMRSHTTGWQPTCDHDAPPIGSVVLDPFAGSGTVGAVCRELGRRFIGLDLSGQYLRELALPRAERKNTRAALMELPLFAEAERGT